MLQKDFEIFHYHDTYVHKVELHHHDFFEIYYLLSEKATYTVEDRQYQLKTGDILLISPNELHSVYVPDGSYYERIVLWISRRFLKRLSTENTDLEEVFIRTRENKNNLLRLSQNQSMTVDSFLRQISVTSDTQGKKFYGNDLTCVARLIDLLIRLNDTYRYDANQTDSMKNDVVNSAITYINQNLGDSELSVEKVAAALYISSSRLSHLFKKCLSTSVWQYIIKKRLVLAKELLREYDSVIEVCPLCGFDDYTGFFRAFKREYGLTPKQYCKLTKHF